MQNLLFGVPHLLISGFLVESESQQKLAKISLTLHYIFTQKNSSYKPHLTKHQKYTPATKPKILKISKIFQKTFLWLVSDKAFV